MPKPRILLKRIEGIPYLGSYNNNYTNSLYGSNFQRGFNTANNFALNEGKDRLISSALGRGSRAAFNTALGKSVMRNIFKGSLEYGLKGASRIVPGINGAILAYDVANTLTDIPYGEDQVNFKQRFLPEEFIPQEQIDDPKYKEYKFKEDYKKDTSEYLKYKSGYDYNRAMSKSPNISENAKYNFNNWAEIDSINASKYIPVLSPEGKTYYKKYK